MMYYQGCWWCCRCGSYSTVGGQKSSPKNLLKECSGRPSRGQRGFLSRLGKGLPPKPSLTWRPLSLEEAFAGLGARPRLRLRSKQALALDQLQVDLAADELLRQDLQQQARGAALGKAAEDLDSEDEEGGGFFDAALGLDDPG